MDDNKMISCIAIAVCAAFAIFSVAQSYKDAAVQNKITACYNAGNKNCEK